MTWKKFVNMPIYVLGILVIIGWSSVVAFVCYERTKHAKDMIEEIATQQARMLFNTDYAIRWWASKHGGVYVPVTEETPPNPYLKVKNRDVETTKGIKLTLMNPAYVVRQINELFSELVDVNVHITSLKPIRPANKPNEWEEEALRGFNEGKKEYSFFDEESGYLNLMRPLAVKKECLKCHATQGYKEGDIRGGVSVALPMSSLIKKSKHNVSHDIFTIGLVWFSGSVLIGILFFFLEKRVSEKNLVNESLKKSETRLLNAQSIAHLGSWDWDIVNNKIWWSNEVYNIYGVKPSEKPLTYEDYFKYISPEDKPLVESFVKKLLDGRETYHLEHRIILEDGTEKIVHEQGKAAFDAEGNPVSATGIVQDVTKQKQLTKLVQDNERKYRAIFDNAHQLTGLMSPDGRLLEANRTSLLFIGCRIEDVQGMFFWDTPWWKESADRYVVRDLVDKAAKGMFVREELVSIASDGSEHIIDFSLKPITDEKGTVIYLIPEGKDITKKKQVEEETTRLETHLRQAQKMEAMGTLAGGIAHDFNNILSAVIGYSELAQDSLEKGGSPIKEVKQVIKAGDRAKDLVQQILAFSRQAEYDVKPVQIHLIVKEALKLLRASIPTTIEILQNIDSNCGYIMADPTQIHQIVMNLCTNAYHAMKEKGGVLGITLKTKNVSYGEHVENLSLTPGAYLVLEVSDNGVGISRDLVKSIFNPYFTTKEKGEGTGLGLSVVHGIVKSYGGHITVYSEPDVGTTFHVYLPQAESSDMEDDSNQVIIPRGNNEKILLVDDEDTIVSFEKTLLRNLGYSVIALQDSKRAWALFQNDPKLFDIVITDMSMPGMDGATLTKNILKLRPDMPVIMCTGFSEIINEKKAMAIGIKGYLMKPVLKADLANAIRNALDSKY